MEAATVVIRNKGIRTYDLGTFPTGEKRTLGPSKSIEVTPQEAALYLQYHDIEDAAQAVPQTAARLEAVMAENACLKAELKAMKADEGATDKPLTGEVPGDSVSLESASTPAKTEPAKAEPKRKGR